MEKGRDDFVIAIRSAFLKKGTQQRFSIFSLILFSIVFLILGSFNLKAIDYVKNIIKDVIYTSSFIASIPENLIQTSYKSVSDHYSHYDEYKKIKSELELFKTKDLSKQIIIFENIKLKKVIDDYFVTTNETYAKVLIDKESPFLRSIILNKGSKNGIKKGMIVLDDIHLIGKVVEVNYLTSRALLASDINSKVPVTIEPIDIQAIMSGTGKNEGVLQYVNVENFESNNEDLIVVTSGAGSVYNSGIPIGIIERESDLTSGEIPVKFYKDFTQLKYVKIVSNEKVTVDQPKKQEFELNTQQLTEINNQKNKFDVLKQQKTILEEVRNKIEKENSELKEKLILSQKELKKLERQKNQIQIDQDEINFLRLNYQYGHKCRKTFYNQLFKIGTPEYKACVLSKGEKIN
tara:strand:- start:4833 stop:6047 length:1215 start_codon:yes stop_codon:yes gene_type:complete